MAEIIHWADESLWHRWFTCRFTGEDNSLVQIIHCDGQIGVLCIDFHALRFFTFIDFILQRTMMYNNGESEINEGLINKVLIKRHISTNFITHQFETSYIYHMLLSLKRNTLNLHSIHNKFK